MSRTLSCTLMLLLTGALSAAVIRVPADQPTIQAGIDAAVHDDTVLVANGLYTGEGNRDIDFHGKRIVVRSENGPVHCIIDCQADESDPHLGFNFQSGEGPFSVLKGFTIRGAYYPIKGGGIRCNYSFPSIRDNIIIGNSVGLEGGGIFCNHASPTISGNLITGNSGGNNAGGIVCWIDSAPLIEGNAISANLGTGIICRGGASPQIIGNVISGNFGSGISCTHGADALISSNLISGNQGGIGGGIHLFQASPEIRDNRFIDNTASLWGGGISARSYCNPVLVNNLFAGNTSGSLGGAIYASSNIGMRIDSCTFAGNHAEEAGGGIYCSGSDSSADITDGILWGNSAPLGPQIYIAHWYTESIVTIGYSSVEGGAEAVYIEPDAGSVVWGPGAIDADPLFVSGPYGDHFLSQTAAGQSVQSPCVDTGDPASSMIKGTTRTDLIQDSGIIDMGYHYPFDLVRNRLVTGPGPASANPPLVRVYPPGEEAAFEAEFTAYGASRFGVNVACGDVTGNGFDEIITGPGPGEIFGPHVRGFDADGQPLPGLDFQAYGTPRFGVNVAAGDLDGDGFDEILTGAGPGAVFGPHVRAFDYDGSSAVAPLPGVNFFAYGTNKYGVVVSAGDLDGDGFDEIITGAGPGEVFGPHVRGWNVDGGTAASIPGVNFFAYATHSFGVAVTCGDIDGDGFDEIVTAPGPSLAFPSHIRGWNYDGESLTPMSGVNFIAWTPYLPRYGATVHAGADLDLDDRKEIIVGAGPDPSAGALVRVFGYDGEEVTLQFSLQAYDSGMTHGVNVAAGRF